MFQKCTHFFVAKFEFTHFFCRSESVARKILLSGKFSTFLPLGQALVVKTTKGRVQLKIIVFFTTNTGVGWGVVVYKNNGGQLLRIIKQRKVENIPT